MLTAHGYSYQEISEITGWSYTKVNRCLTEGRRSFRERFADIEAGRECERWRALLSAAADGEAAAGDLTALRLHLRGCAACRATLRDYRMANRGVAAVLPLASGATTEASAGEAPSLALRLYEAVAGGVQERAATAAYKLHAGLEAASAGKVAAVAASATALAGGGAAVVRGPLDRQLADRHRQSAAPARVERSGPPSRHYGADAARTARGIGTTVPGSGRRPRGRGVAAHPQHESQAGPALGQDEFGPAGRVADAPPGAMSVASAPTHLGPDPQAGFAQPPAPGADVQDATDQPPPKEEIP